MILIVHVDDVAPRKLKHLFYVNFDSHITEPYGIVIENWPIAKFCCPGDIQSKLELEALFNAFDISTARFRILTDKEHSAWKEARFQAALAQTTGPGHALNDGGIAQNADDHSQPTPPSLAGPSNLSTPSELPSTPAASQDYPIMFNNIFAVTGHDGRPMAIKQTRRKARLDKGKLKGPRAKTAASGAGPSGESTTSQQD